MYNYYITLHVIVLHIIVHVQLHVIVLQYNYYITVHN